MYVVGKYNVTERGRSWGQYGDYNEVIIQMFDDDDKEVSRKLFYFKGRVPKFETEAQVDSVYRYIGNSRLHIAEDLFIRPV